MRGMRDVFEFLARHSPVLIENQSTLWPTTGTPAQNMRKVLDLADPLYFRTLQHVLPLLKPLMRDWEVEHAEEELRRWEETSTPELSDAATPPLGDEPDSSSLLAL